MLPLELMEQPFVAASLIFSRAFDASCCVAVRARAQSSVLQTVFCLARVVYDGNTWSKAGQEVTRRDRAWRIFLLSTCYQESLCRTI